MSSTSYPKDNPNPNPDPETTNDANQTSKTTPLALPSASSTDSTPTTTIDMSGGNTTVQLDHLGPMVVNTDGTMSRISNWDKMAEIERKATLRIIGKRNQVRLEALRKEAEEAGGKGDQ